MSSSILSLPALSAVLLLVVGCAAQADDGTEDPDTTEGKAPAVETDTVDTTATSTTCGCAAGQELQNGLCYANCSSGWKGEGPVCWQTCASGFKDTGWFCQRDSKVIGADTKSCPWYNKCGVNSSCNKCPAGYANDGCTCRLDAYIYAQPSYGRGAGTVPSCTTN
jgi:hypothetical protein